METRELYHGTNGDNILQILQFKMMKPNGGKIFFSRFSLHSAFMHGADQKRKQTFVIKVRVRVPDAATVQLDSTKGVATTLVLHTTDCIFTEVLDLYVRSPGGSEVETIRGAAEIKRYLTGRSE